MGTLGYNRYEDSQEAEILQDTEVNTVQVQIMKIADHIAEEQSLDFSIGSLMQVDTVLKNAGEMLSYQQDAVIENSAYAMGCYIFEVARRIYGGNYYWHEKLNQPILVIGEPDFAVSCLAVEKAKDRILNSMEEHLIFYFKCIDQHIQKGRKHKGYKALVV